MIYLNDEKEGEHMSELIESLKRLYQAGEITDDYINARASLTEKEKAYIIGIVYEAKKEEA